MERRCQHADNKKCEIPGIGQIVRDGCIGGSAVGDPTLGVKMPTDINESYKPGPTLQSVQPVANPRVLRDVRLAAQPDVHAETTVIEEGQKDKHPFHEK